MILSKFLNSFFQYGSIYILSFSVVRLGILGPLHWKDDLGIPYKKSIVKNGIIFRLLEINLALENFIKYYLLKYPI